MTSIRQIQLALIPVLLLFFLQGSSAHAAKISCADVWSETTPGFDENVLTERFPSGRRPTPDSCRTIYIEGTIVSSDAAQFQQLLRQNHPFVSTVILNSPGGNVAASIEIGELVRKYFLITVVPSLPQT